MTERTEARPGPRDERGVLAARILATAREEFAANGYAGTTLRAIARRAGVDPALVYHYFGTKDGLLEACTEPPPAWRARIAEVWAGPSEHLGSALVRVTLENWRAPDSGPTIRAILLIAAHHPATRERLRRLVANQLMGPARIGVDEGERTVRSSLIASQLLGLGLMRHVWRIEPLASMPDDDVVAAIGPTIQRYADGGLASG